MNEIKGCVVCDFPVSEGRLKIGYVTCLRCGDQDAQEDIRAKQKRVGVAYNKGGYQYLGEGEEAKQAALDVGRKDGGFAKPNESKNFYYSPIPKTTEVRKVKKRKMLGIRYENGDRFIVWSDEN